MKSLSEGLMFKTFPGGRGMPQTSLGYVALQPQMDFPLII